MTKNVLFILNLLLITFLTTSCNNSAPQEFKDIAAEMNRELPLQLSEELRLDRVHAISKDEFQFDYTLMYEPEETEADFKQRIKEAIIQDLKSAPSADTELFKKNNMKLIYVYSTRDGVTFGKIVIDPNEYK